MVNAVSMTTLLSKQMSNAGVMFENCCQHMMTNGHWSKRTFGHHLTGVFTLWLHGRTHLNCRQIVGVNISTSLPCPHNAKQVTLYTALKLASNGPFSMSLQRHHSPKSTFCLPWEFQTVGSCSIWRRWNDITSGFLDVLNNVVDPVVILKVAFLLWCNDDKCCSVDSIIVETNV